MNHHDSCPFIVSLSQPVRSCLSTACVWAGRCAPSGGCRSRSTVTWLPSTACASSDPSTPGSSSPAPKQWYAYTAIHWHTLDVGWGALCPVFVCRVSKALFATAVWAAWRFSQEEVWWRVCCRSRLVSISVILTPDYSMCRLEALFRVPTGLWNTYVFWKWTWIYMGHWKCLTVYILCKNRNVYFVLFFHLVVISKISVLCSLANAMADNGGYTVYSCRDRKNSTSLTFMLSDRHPWDLITAGWSQMRHWLRCVLNFARERWLATQSVISKNYCKCKSFHQWTIGSVTIVLTRSAIDGDFTDIYLQENLQDFLCKPYHF